MRTACSGPEHRCQSATTGECAAWPRPVQAIEQARAGTAGAAECPRAPGQDVAALSGCAGRTGRVVLQVAERPLTGAEREPEESGSASSQSIAGAHAVLAGCALVFGALAYLNWVFGLCACILALLAAWEARPARGVLWFALIAGALATSALGAGANLWFATVVPRAREATQARIREQCAANLREVSSALRQYIAGTAAPPRRLEELVAAGLLRPSALCCPGSAAGGRPGVPYAYFPPSEEEADDPFGVAAADASPANHDGTGGWVLRRDGRLDWLGAEQLTRLLERRETAASGQPGPRREPGPAGGR
jgi:hypothetical protein